MNDDAIHSISDLFSRTAPEVRHMLSSKAVRERCEHLWQQTLLNKSPYFAIDDSRWDDVTDFVACEIKTNYPDLNVPIHSRLRHFEVSVDKQPMDIRWQALGQGVSSLNFSQNLIDLICVSVFLDAGAGATWKYFDKKTQRYFSRSEGLGLASFEAFSSGVFSLNPHQPHEVHAEALLELSNEQGPETARRRTLNQIFQLSQQNSIIGWDDRVNILARFGRTLLKFKHIHTQNNTCRPCFLFTDMLQSDLVAAPEVLRRVLLAWGSMWPNRLAFANVSLGDCWTLPGLGFPDEKLPDAIPFHKLSQWLTYSLIDAMMATTAVKNISHSDQLTGLAEYRNGGLFIDLGLFRPKQTLHPLRPYPVDHPLVVTWRGLTVAALDMLLVKVRRALSLDAEQLTLGSLLQGGSWSAGRRIAKSLRPDGSLPISIASDGTVF